MLRSSCTRAERAIAVAHAASKFELDICCMLQAVWRLSGEAKHVCSCTERMLSQMLVPRSMSCAVSSGRRASMLSRCAQFLLNIYSVLPCSVACPDVCNVLHPACVPCCEMSCYTSPACQETYMSAAGERGKALGVFLKYYRTHTSPKSNVSSPKIRRWRPSQLVTL